MKIYINLKLYCIAILLSVSACQNDESSSISNSSQLFSSIAPSQSGINFENNITVDLTNGQNIMAYEYFYNGGGVGIGDFDNDGLPDVFMAGNEVADKLYRNKGNLKFEDITNTAGITSKGWSLGVSVVDINLDGWLDIYVCRGGPTNGLWNSQNVLYINKQDGTFIEQAAAYGLNDPNLSTQAAFFDYDKDGDLDAYVMNESPFARASAKKQSEVLQNKDLLRKSSGRFFINENNKFRDISEQAGTLSYGYGLGLAVSDFNEDGWLDFYVTNDYTIPDKLFINQQDGSFRDELKIRTKHIPWFAMGIDVADINNDSHLDMAIVEMASTDHVRGKTLMATMDSKTFWQNINQRKYQYQYMFNSLQISDQEGGYYDAAAAYNVLSTDWSWAPLLADYDNDGYKDYYVTNGFRKYINDNDFRQKLRDYAAKQGAVPPAERAALYETIPEAKIANLAFQNKNGKSFEAVTNWGLNQESYSNGAAYSDLDNDGDLDLIVNNIDQKAFLYENNSNSNFLTVQLKSNLPITGTSVKCYTEDGITQLQKYSPVRGFLSSMVGPLHFGLGKNDHIEKIEITWPDGKMQTIKSPEINKRMTVQYNQATGQDSNTNKEAIKVFEAVNNLGIDFVHTENRFDDFNKEVLLPYRQATLGPFINKGDINGDGLEDFFIGGARGQAGKLYIQSKASTFSSSSDNVFATDADYEDMGSLFFDADGDGDQDLYIVSGGNSYDFGSSLSQDRLYINQGNGQLKKEANRLPVIKYSGSRVKNADLDGDGDQDLIIGGRLKAQEYPVTPKSYILINEGGIFIDKTEEWSADFASAGLVNDIIVSDLNGDKKPDLVVAGEWMKILFLENTGDHFENKSDNYLKENDGGWWFRLLEEDVDQDGDMDIIAGNLGLNSKYSASYKKPFEVLANDFDKNGVTDIVLTKDYNGKRVPVRGKECSTEQMPFIKEKFPSYEGFATSSIDEILGKEIENALRLQVTNFRSTILINEGGSFTPKELPKEIDLFPVYGIVSADVNQDGKNDLIATGNIYQTEIETPRIDSGNGLVLINKGNGDYEPMLSKASGYKTPADAKDLCTLTLANGKTLLLVSNNSNIVQQFVLK